MATGIQRLHFMIGEWDIEAYNMGEDGEWQSSPIPNWTNIESVFDGAFIQEQVVPMFVGGVAIRFFIMWSYDKYRQVYRMLACDDQEGLADILEGNYEADSETIVVSNVGTGTAILDDQGQQICLRLSSTKNNDDSFTDEMYESADGGQTWMPVYRAVHTRKR